MFSADLSALNSFSNVHYSGGSEGLSSIWNTTPHGEQGLIREVVVNKAGLSMKAECEKRWPQCWEYMLDVTRMINDMSISTWQNYTVEPASREKAGSKRVGVTPNPGFAGTHGVGGGASRGRAVNVPQAAVDARREWCDAELRKRGFKMDSFKPDIDGREADFATSTSSKPRLVAMPNIPAMDRTLDEILGGDPEVASLHMGICELHAGMRHPENMMDKVEDFLRTAATSGVGEAAVAGFNGTLRKVLLMRHAIQVDPKAKTKTVYPPALDGGDSRRWRKDLLEMYSGPAESRPALRARLEGYAASGKWPSVYFQALHTAALALSNRRSDVVTRLPAIAEACIYYAVAARCGSMPPEEMRKYGAEAVWTEFEGYARLHTAAWAACGFTYKAYGFHLWANMPTLFSNWGSLSLISQQGMEGSIGKMSRMLKHIQMKACGRYKKAVLALGVAGRLAELEKRRAGLASPAQYIYDEMLAETMAAKVEHLPSRKNETTNTAFDITRAIDHCIASGKVLANLQLQRDHAKSMIVSCVIIRHLRFYLFKAQPGARPYFKELLAEHYEYYRQSHLSPTTALTSGEAIRVRQRARSLWYHNRARHVWAGGKRVAGRHLTYQRTFSWVENAQH